MTDLIYTATEARNDFFNLLMAAKKKNRRVVVVKNKKFKFEIKLLEEKITKKPTWEDVMGDGSKETKEAMRIVEETMKITDKLPARGTPQW